MRHKIYIAGRISGDVPGAKVRFKQAAEALELAGWWAINPFDVAENEPTWEACMKADLKAMLDCVAVYALDGWRTSKGATIEIQLAMRLGLQVVYQDFTPDDPGCAL